MTSSHYPTTAELAAFRRSIVDASKHPHWNEPVAPFGRTPGAWPHEREQGIGYTFGQQSRLRRGRPFEWPSAEAFARREANRMRRNAYYWLSGETPLADD